jgi:hypothetical protein
VVPRADSFTGEFGGKESCKNNEGETKSLSFDQDFGLYAIVGLRHVVFVPGAKETLRGVFSAEGEAADFASHVIVQLSVQPFELDGNKRGGCGRRV